MRLFLLSCIYLVVSLSLQAQVVSISPEAPGVDSTITITYDASQGNGALQGAAGPIYIHTGVLSPASADNSDWQNVQGNWATADPNVEMTSLGNNLYTISFNISSYYGLAPNDAVLALAMVFRNQDGTVVGKTADDADILYELTLREYQSHSLVGNKVIVVGANGNLEILPYTDRSIQVATTFGNGTFSDTSYSVIAQPYNQAPTVTDNANSLMISTGPVEITVDKTDLTLTYMVDGDMVLSESQGYYENAEGRGLKFDLQADESIYGAGSRAIPVNRRGFRFDTYNRPNYSYSNGAQTLNISIPFITSSNTYGLYFENRSPAIFDVGFRNENELTYESEFGTLSYIFIGANSNDQLLEEYTHLTGRQPLPPRWAMGYIQSRFGYQSEQEVRNLINTMKQDDWPIDAVILDLYWFGQANQTGNMAWDLNNWPNPTQMIQDFKNDGIKTILISQPFVTQNSFNYADAEANLLFGRDITGNFTYIIPGFWAGPAGLLDITNPAMRRWMWNKYKDRTDEGVAGWWCDLVEPETHPDDLQHLNGGGARNVHNIYALLWAEMLYENYKINYPNQRLFNLIRSGYAGSQRFSTILWSGDVARNWSGLQSQLPIMLGAGMSGSAYMHSDAGGFAAGGPDDDLFTRWIQFSAFTPIMRPHGDPNANSEPVYYNSFVQNATKPFIELRYKLLPYNYTLAYNNSTIGRPLALPMCYFDPRNTAVKDISDQYYWGPNFLVAPLLDAGQSSRNVILPEGNWTNFFSGEVYSGPGIVNVSSAFEELPLLVKGGSIIPTTPLITSTDDYTGDSLIVWHYFDTDAPNNQFTMFEDNGSDPNSLANEAYTQLELTANYGNSQLEIGVDDRGMGNGYAGMPTSRNIIWHIRNGVTSPTFVAQQQDTFLLAASLNDIQTNTYYWDDTDSNLYVSFQYNSNPTSVIINWDSTSNPIDTTTHIAAIEKTIHAMPAMPNPFSRQVAIPFAVTDPGTYTLKIFDLQGKQIFSANMNTTQAGTMQFIWNGNDTFGGKLPVGIYSVQISGAGIKANSQRVVKINP